MQGAAGQLQVGGGQGGPQAGGGLAGGGGQVDAAFRLLGLHRGQHARHGAGFARARPPFQQHQAVPQHRAHGPLLVPIQSVGGGGLPRGLQRPLGPGDQGLQHPFPLALPAAPQQPIALQGQGAVGLGTEGRGGQGLAMAGAGHRDLQLALREGHGQGFDQLPHQGIGAGAVQPRQRFAEGLGQGLQPGGLFRGLAGVHWAPPRTWSRASSRARGGCSRNIPGTNWVALVAPGTPRRNTYT